MISRISNTSRMSCGRMWATAEPRPGTFSTNPSRSSWRRASRTGVLLTARSRAKSASLIGSPGCSSPSMMRRRRLSYTIAFLLFIGFNYATIAPTL